MNVHRLLYAITLVAAIFFYVLYPPWISWYLLILILLLIPFDLVISLPGMLSKDIVLSAPLLVEKDKEGVIALITTHIKSYPVRYIYVKVFVSGDGFSAAYKLRCSPEKDARREVILDTSNSGLTEIRIKRFWTVSLIGLFSLPVSRSIRKTTLILPLPAKPSNTVSLQHGFVLRPKHGGGFSEEHDMRVYRPGDPVRSIHWKASAKFDSLLIREPLVPPPNSRLVHIMKWNTASECDLILGHLRWVANYMLKRRLPFFVKYADVALIKEMKQESDLTDFLRCALDEQVAVITKSDPLPTRFTWVYKVEAGQEVAK